MNNIGRLIKLERIKQNMSQAALSEGICSNTYLSKIENDLVEADIEIYQMLIAALSYTYDNTNVSECQSIIEKLWESAFDFNIERTDASRAVYDTLDKCRFSDISLDVSLTFFLFSVLLDNDESFNQYKNELDNNKMSRLQYDRYTFVIAHKYYMNRDDSILRLMMLDKIATMAYLKGNYLATIGNYGESIKYSEKAFEYYSRDGDIIGMIWSSFNISNSYGNLNRLDDQVHISNRIIKLNKYLKNPLHDFYVHYNLGSSYLSQGDYDKALSALLIAYNNQAISKEDFASVEEKLALLYLLNDEFEKALTHINKIREQNVYKLLMRLYTTNNDIRDKDYIYHLELAYQSVKNVHHGRQLLFGSLLYRSYKQTYQYPKALNLLEEISFLENSIFFEKSF